MKKTRRKFSTEFKTKVSIEAIKERYTLSELANRFELHPNQISQWKKEFLDNAENAFTNGKPPGKTEEPIDIEKLYVKIGQLEMERDYLKKSLRKLDRMI